MRPRSSSGSRPSEIFHLVATRKHLESGRARHFLCSRVILPVLVVLVAILIPCHKWAFQTLCWYSYVALAPSGHKRYVPKFPPDMYDYNVRGKPVAMSVTDRRVDFLENEFRHQPGDVWLSSYYKVGSVWTQYVLSMVLGNSRAATYHDLLQSCPWPESDFGLFAHSEKALQKTMGPKPRCFKTHWPRQDFMETLPNTSKVIYVLRDAESVAISYWHHVFSWYGDNWLEDGDMTWNQFFHKWLHGDVQMGGYFEHVASWWKARNDTNILFLRYEDMKVDTAATVQRIIDFLGAQVDQERVAQILDATSKTNMRKWHDTFIAKFLKYMGIMRGEHVRLKGNESVRCTDEQRASMLEKYEAVLKPLGMPVEYMFANKHP